MLFIPAGSLRFWQGWVFMILVFRSIISFCLFSTNHAPQLLERRLQSQEKVSEQRLLNSDS